MALAALLNLPIGDPALDEWSFCHAANHFDIIRVLGQKTGTNLSSFILDPFDPYDPGDLQAWLANHQVMHQQMDANLGVSGYDLSEVDWRDPVGLQAWLQANFDEHQRASEALGLG
jgi:hypothetical protein